MNKHDIIIKPIISEKSMDQMADKKYTFKVALNANKIEIARAVEDIFGVKVDKVTTVRVNGKVKRMGATSGRTPEWKKAIVKLTQDSKTIEFFDSMA